MEKLTTNVKFLTFLSVILLLLVCGGARPSQAQTLIIPSGILKASSVLASHAGVSVTFSQVNGSLKGDVDLAGSTHMIVAPTTGGTVTIQNQDGSTFDVVADQATNIQCPPVIGEVIP